jgi:hypothetical protein
MTTTITFDEASNRAGEYTKCHSLLGNGFSIAYRADIFAYGALFDRADFTTASTLARNAFDALDTRDFEVVMRALRDAGRLLELNGDQGLAMAPEFHTAVDALRGVLVSTIAGHHPDQPNEISARQFHSCRSFLSRFDSVYTLNYDLLLYWAMMQKEGGPKIKISDDGFRTPEDGPAAYVSWEVENSDAQNVFYLHGALHLFDAGAELQKYTWINTGRRLTDQIREALERSFYPLIVAEGRSEQKKAKIMHSNYLSRAYRSLLKVGGSIFLHGHSLAVNDDHILHLIRRGKSRHLFVSLFGDPDSESNQEIVSRAQRLVGDRNQRRIDFYDAASASVWG